MELLLFAALASIAALSVRLVTDSAHTPRPEIAAPLAAEPTDDVVAPSISVLPLRNISGDPSQDYFGDGHAEELINAIARVAEFGVAPRTSASAAQARALDVVEVGLGEQDEAVRWLREAVATRDWYVGLIGLADPSLDPLRADPRFGAILELAGLR